MVFLASSCLRLAGDLAFDAARLVTQADTARALGLSWVARQKSTLQQTMRCANDALCERCLDRQVRGEAACAAWPGQQCRRPVRQFSSTRVFAMVFNNRERVDIVAAFREANNNANEARRIYAARFPQRRLPDRGVFRRTTVNLQVHGAFQIPIARNGQVVGQQELRALVVQQVEANPHVGKKFLFLWGPFTHYLGCLGRGGGGGGCFRKY